MIRALLWILSGLILGGIVHLSTVLAMPQAATQDAYSRLTPLTPVNTMVSLAAPTADTDDHAVHGSGLRRGGVPLRSDATARSS